jgi:hypothetical protein
MILRSALQWSISKSFSKSYYVWRILVRLLAYFRFLDGFLGSGTCSNQCGGQIATMAKSCLVYLFGFDTLYMVAYFLNPRTTIYGIVSIFDAKYTVENYWMWFGICNMVLAGYTIVTHVVLFFLLRSALFDRVFPIYVPFYGLVAPVITSLSFSFLVFGHYWITHPVIQSFILEYQPGYGGIYLTW